MFSLSTNHSFYYNFNFTIISITKNFGLRKEILIKTNKII